MPMKRMKCALVSGLLGAVVMATGSCSTAQLMKLEERIQHHDDEFAVLKGRVGELEKESDQLWRAIGCRNQRVRDFISACRKNPSTGQMQCTQKAVEVAMHFLKEEQHEIVLLPSGKEPREAMSALSNYRMAKLKLLFDPDNISRVTSFVLVVLPQGDKPAQATEADAMQRLFRNRMIREFGIKEERFLYSVISCQGKRQVLSDYKDELRNEPDMMPPGSAQVVMWAFRVNCSESNAALQQGK